MKSSPTIGCFSVLLVTVLVSPCSGFYRLWGYSDLTQNLKEPALLKAQPTLLTRGGKKHSKSLCQSFPDPSFSQLSILRVVGVMNHPAATNPVQAIGFWQEESFSCWKSPPAAVIYFQPDPKGDRAQIVDLRPFRAEQVYSNWKQILPGDWVWDTYIQPELDKQSTRGRGFVKRITRDPNNLNAILAERTVWDTDVPVSAWTIDTRPSVLTTSPSKNGFERIFKDILELLEADDKINPLSPDMVRRLRAELKVMKAALMRQYGQWVLDREKKEAEFMKKHRIKPSPIENTEDSGSGSDIVLLENDQMDTTRRQFEPIILTYPPGDAIDTPPQPEPLTIEDRFWPHELTGNFRLAQTDWQLLQMMQEQYNLEHMIKALIADQEYRTARALSGTLNRDSMVNTPGGYLNSGSIRLGEHDIEIPPLRLPDEHVSYIGTDSKEVPPLHQHTFNTRYPQTLNGKRRLPPLNEMFNNVEGTWQLRDGYFPNDIIAPSWPADLDPYTGQIIEEPVSYSADKNALLESAGGRLVLQDHGEPGRLAPISRQDQEYVEDLLMRVATWNKRPRLNQK
ncbi:hypothetical protein H072_7769 [Dactylellina haptotyla CBS 200.50]|uniref:Uncharacterized protein n=1 Tax=Dactylellina haptotyla (strain CBS 200.50) TaxID=1284197 RepID=S8BTB9_DACHA|nr:hypothetical protein H072_7769 [Dactylellina haptotyla CBS 200.50]